MEVSQILQLERSGRNRDARTAAEDPQENNFAVSENFENEKVKSIAPTYDVSDLTLLNVCDYILHKDFSRILENISDFS